MKIRQKQAILAFFDCYDGLLDGKWGQLSATGTGKLQRRLGIPEDNVFGSQTEAAARKAIGKGQTMAEPDEEEGRPDWWEGIRYWTREEFRCRCREYYPESFCNGFPVEPDRTLVELVDGLRARAGAPGHRSSGIRCREHNARSGGVDNSRHIRGKALDFCIEGMDGDTLLRMALEDGRTNYAYRIKASSGQLTDYVHVDVK